MAIPTFYDRIQETTVTTGTGTLTLAGAVTGYQSFAAVGNGTLTYYCITDETNWEVGSGTYTSSGTTLSRTTILASSNSGSAVNFGAGTKNVFQPDPATFLNAVPTGSGTNNALVKWTATGSPSVLGNSNINDNGSGTITINKGQDVLIQVNQESTDTAGDTVRIFAGAAGTASASAGQYGGSLFVNGGNGANGTASKVAGLGGGVGITGGTAGTNNGAGGNNGGEVDINGGQATGSGVGGSVYIDGGYPSGGTINIGTNYANTINIGRSAGTTAFSGAITGLPTATQANQESASSTTVFVTPGRQQYHPSASKAWVSCSGTTLNANYGVTSVTNGVTGNYVITWTTVFSSANYCVLATSTLASGSGVICSITAQSTTSITVNTYKRSDGSNINVDTLYVVAFGDQ